MAVHLLELQKEGYAKLTIVSHSSILRYLAKHCDLHDPENIRLFLSEKQVSPARKERIANAYLKYSRWRHIRFDKPRYEAEDKLPFIPLQNEIESILEYFKNLRHGTYLRLVYESGLRAGEASRLQFKDFDFERRTVRITPEKRGRAREVKLSSKLCAMLMQVYARYSTEQLPNATVARKHLERIRKRLARISCNPRLLGIHLHTLRHFRATILYHQTKDILYVKEVLGHRSIANTLKYTHLVDWQSDDFLCKAARTVEEASKLIEAGFDFVTQVDDVKLFRKRK
ncbi:MAG TPA: tyrosine-type recombinase/integrase [Candidatus Bathyarchaeia archaeon]|nr:tyrosine-type recombinase/integrase [Candidatus Bathyarchaeia archaeon]